MKVTMEMSQVLIEQGNLLHKQAIGTILQGMIFLNSFTLLQLDRLQLTAVYCKCVNTTPQMPREYGAKHM